MIGCALFGNIFALFGSLLLLLLFCRLFCYRRLLLLCMQSQWLEGNRAQALSLKTRILAKRNRADAGHIRCFASVQLTTGCLSLAVWSQVQTVRDGVAVVHNTNINLKSTCALGLGRGFALLGWRWRSAVVGILKVGVRGRRCCRLLRWFGYTLRQGENKSLPDRDTNSCCQSDKTALVGFGRRQAVCGLVEQSLRRQGRKL